MPELHVVGLPPLSVSPAGSTAPILAAPASMGPHIQKIMAGEYDIPKIKEQPKIVLDIGANVGAFAVWAHHKWPEAEIYCYEPSESNFSLLCKNVPFAILERVAIRQDGPPGIGQLFKGLNNCGECSLNDLGEQDKSNFEMVTTIGADQLPEADFVKVDTEGCELLILSSYLQRVTPKAVALEWHSLQDRVELRQLLIGKGYTISDTQWRDHRGNIKAWI